MQKEKDNFNIGKIIDELGHGGALEFVVRMALEYITFPIGYGPGDLITLLEGLRDCRYEKWLRGIVKIVAALLPHVPSVAVAMGIEKIFPTKIHKGKVV